MDPHCFVFDEESGGNDFREEILDQVLGQVGCGAKVLPMTLAGVEAIALDVTIEGSLGCYGEKHNERDSKGGEQLSDMA